MLIRFFFLMKTDDGYSMLYSDKDVIIINTELINYNIYINM